MKNRIPGIHHITAIAEDPQRNIDFYSGFLGLRLVKKTVNYDDPATYHLYYGDEVGHPGTILTFFPWPGAENGSRGNGQLTTISFAVPENSLGYWMDHLNRHHVIHQSPLERMDEEVLTLLDPDGLRLELVVRRGAELIAPWEEGPVPSKYAIRGFHGVTLSEEGYELTSGLLRDTLGFEITGQEGSRFRFKAGDSFVDVLCLPDEPMGRVAVGTVHHVAFRTPLDEEQVEWRQKLSDAGLNVTPVIDRRYFHSIYFREPGGVLFEIATDPPGFTIDEPVERLGTGLMLPPWLERIREQIEHVLPPVEAPRGAPV